MSVHLVKSLYFIKYLETQFRTFIQAIEWLCNQFRTKFYGGFHFRKYFSFFASMQTTADPRKDLYGTNSGFYKAESLKF
jgi:hypothetical protein